jgi:hypothetical protein
LPPFDHFGVNWRFNKVLAARQAKKQGRVNEEARQDYCRKKAEREKKRLEIEAREREEEAREKEREAALTGRGGKRDAETDAIQLMEVDTLHSADAEAITQIAVDADIDAAEQEAADAQAEADAVEAAVDSAEMENEFATEAEAEADVDADADIAAEMEMEMETEAELEADMAADVDVDADTDADADDAALVEAESDAAAAQSPSGEIVLDAQIRADSKPMVPSAHVSYNRDSLEDKSFDNKDSRAVFRRRENHFNIVRATKKFQSTGGQAVVNGVTKTPCGKEITDRGLFAPQIQQNLQATVEAANPQPPKRVDENINAIRAMPIVPEFKSTETHDEYGDEIA